MAGFDLLGRKVRCPKCRASLQVPVRTDAAEPAAAPPGSRCTICLSGLEGAGAVLCPSCRIVYHAECWRETGGCGTFGCPLAPEAPKDEPDAGAPVQTAWGDTKECPSCGKEIQAIAIKCRFCKADLGTRDAVSSREWQEIQRRKAADGKGRLAAIAAFGCSATCVGIPVGVGIALYHLMDPRRRSLLEGPDRVLHFGALGITGCYLALFLLMKVIGW